MLDKYPRLCISAGHGMSSRVKGKVDPGANIRASELSEADFVLIQAKRLYADFRVLFGGRRKGFVMLRDGGFYANADDDAAKAMCDLFIELHLNAGGGTGTEVLYNDVRDRVLASHMSTAIANALGIRDRGAKRRTDIAVLKGWRNMAQIIIELFFADSRSDFARYKESSRKMELAIVNGILAHYGWRTVKSLPRKWGQVRRAAYRGW